MALTSELRTEHLVRNTTLHTKLNLNRFLPPKFKKLMFVMTFHKSFLNNLNFAKACSHLIQGKEISCEKYQVYSAQNFRN